MDKTLAHLQELDAADPLRHVRDRFRLPDGAVYLDGNSLGPPPDTAQAHLEQAVTEWRERLIAGWFEAGWAEAPMRVGDRLARLVGASPGEVVVSDSTTVDLYKLIVAALDAQPERRAVVIQPDDFPTDRYVATSLTSRTPGVEVRQVDPDRVSEALDEHVALVLLSHVGYRTGRLLDMRELTRAAHDAGALVLWDLSHSAGALPVDLGACDVDLAAGCTYKFLNGGPGAPAFLYVARRLAGRLGNPIPGWFGHADTFAFAERYAPAAGARRFLTGTPGILGLAALEGALEVWDGVDLRQVREKSSRMGDVLIALIDEACAGRGVTVVSPREAVNRGSQVSISVARAGEVTGRLAERGVVADYRPPDVVRFGLTPLYTRYVDLAAAGEALRSVLDELTARAAP
ncbi:MAG: kynureninase [Candidatus Dormibacteraeota bacterium]|nr:kynureninase [Candidatus Dormibacteraeota bacterium]